MRIVFPEGFLGSGESSWCEFPRELSRVEIVLGELSGRGKGVVLLKKLEGSGKLSWWKFLRREIIPGRIVRKG